MLSLVRRKACKRCGGDLSIECDIYGVFIECIQCGATYNQNEFKAMANPGAANAAKDIPAVPARSIK